MTFGERIKSIRKKKNITQAELGRRMGISQQTIAQYEKAVEQPKYETVVKLARALDVSLAELTSDTSFSSAIQFFMPMIPPTVTAQEHAVRVVSEKAGVLRSAEAESSQAEADRESCWSYPGQPDRNRLPADREMVVPDHRALIAMGSTSARSRIPTTCRSCSRTA